MNSNGSPALVTLSTASQDDGADASSTVAKASQSLRVAMLDAVLSLRSPSHDLAPITMAPFVDAMGVFDTALLSPSHGVLFFFDSQALASAERVSGHVGHGAAGPHICVAVAA